MALGRPQGRTQSKTLVFQNGEGTLKACRGPGLVKVGWLQIFSRSTHMIYGAGLLTWPCPAEMGLGRASARDMVSTDGESSEARARSHRPGWWIASFGQASRGGGRTLRRRTLTAQKHPGVTGIRRKTMGFLNVGEAQGPTLLPRGRQERVAGISPLQAKHGVRSFMGQLTPGQLHPAGGWKEMSRCPKGDDKN